MPHALPRPNAIRAAIRLLGDDSSAVREHCRRRLISWNTVAIEELERAAVHVEDPRLRAQVRAVIRAIDLQQWSEDFEALVADHDPSVDGESGLLIGGLRAVSTLLGGVGARPDRIGRDTDRLAGELRPSVEGRTSTTTAGKLGLFLAKQADFHGVGGSAPEREQVRPDLVLRRGRGTSSLLAALSMVIGRKAGMELSAVELPDFFLVRVHGRRRVLVDPYHDGRTVTRSDCLRYLRVRAPETPAVAHLCSVDDRVLLAGVIDDALRAYDRPADREIRRALRRAVAVLVRSRRTQHS